MPPDVDDIYRLAVASALADVRQRLRQRPIAANCLLTGAAMTGAVIAASSHQDKVSQQKQSLICACSQNVDQLKLRIVLELLNRDRTEK